MKLQKGRILKAEVQVQAEQSEGVWSCRDEKHPVFKKTKKPTHLHEEEPHYERDLYLNKHG